MPRNAKANRGCLWALTGATLLVVLAPWQGLIWDGGFPSVESRLSFVDGKGKPVPGVTLTVLTKGGTVSHFYPVDDFVPEKPLASDAQGRLTFHHSGGGLEFAGHEYVNLLGMRFGETDSPRYQCVFTHEGREVFRTPFNFHHSGWSTYRRPHATREWSLPWDEKQHGPRPGEDFREWERRFFGKPRSEMDREERTAARIFTERLPEAGKSQPTKFIVVERTIVIPNP